MTTTLALGHFRYALDQAETDPGYGGPLSATMLLRHPGGSDPLASLQRLHTDTPELVVYPWVNASERARLETWRQVILAHAQHVWRTQAGATNAAGGDRWQDRPFAALGIANGVAMIALGVYFVVVPAQTPPLALAALSAVICAGSYLGVFWLLLGVRRAMRVTWRVTALAVSFWVLVYAWLRLLDHLSGVAS
ncbi:hypothetical protein AB0B28_06540 [Glycomyces sp. NPDC046736]|uniref:hypothetical protein n=1 Tax=Glycomyces sp. NPDC046736 TaxID=3155615 RepID=UPI0033C10E25